MRLKFVTEVQLNSKRNYWQETWCFQKINGHLQIFIGFQNLTMNFGSSNTELELYDTLFELVTDIACKSM